jgi:DNA polymerase III delta subunit-like protein
VVSSEVDVGFLSLGQSTARTAALQAAASGRLQRTLLVHGPPGAGKGAFVDDLLALLFCEQGNVSQRPCNACRGCRDARARTHPDLVVASPERWRDERSAGESIVSVARRWLIESAGAPVVGERRVLLVVGADRANEQIQNALLKALEEPGPRQMFVLVADEPSRLLPTIRSRAQSLRVGAVPHDELVAWLVDRERIPADQADALARIASGLPGRAIGFARTPSLVEWRRHTQDQLLELLDRGRADRFASVHDLLDDAGRLVAGGTDEPIEVVDDPTSRPIPAAQRAAALLVVDAWLGLTRDLLLAAAGRPSLTPTAQLVPGMEGAAARIGIATLVPFVELLDRIGDGLRENAAPRLALEVAMLAWPTMPAAPTTPAAPAQ